MSTEPSTPGRKWLQGLGGEGFTLVSPFERFGHRPLIIVNKSQHFGFQIFDGGEVTAFQQLSHQNTEPNFNLVHPRRMLGRIVKNNPMIGLREKGGSRFHRLKNTRFSFDAEFRLSDI